MTQSPRSQPTPTSFTPLAEGAPEPFREPTTEVREALVRDQNDLKREVVLWQRWVRYLALIVVLGAAAAVGTSGRFPVMPLSAIALGYTAIVFLTGVAVRKTPKLTAQRWLRALLVTSDL